MLPTITVFMAAHGLTDVVVVADAGMVSEKKLRAIEAEGLWFILGAKDSICARVPLLSASRRRRRRRR
jgi:hypothetical protein